MIMFAPSDLPQSPRSRFIVLEGVDGSGKTTQAALLAEWLRANGASVVLTREPGGTTLAERMRAILLDADVACDPRAELLLFMALRAQHVAEVIAPALQAGKYVIADRFSLSTLAYQGYGRGLPLGEIRGVDTMATGGVTPALTVLLDVSLDVALARIGERQDRFEGEGRLFLQRVIDGYRQAACEDPTVRVLDGTHAPEAVQDMIRQTVVSALGDIPG